MYLCRIPSMGKPQFYELHPFEVRYPENGLFTASNFIMRLARGWMWKGGVSGIAETPIKAETLALDAGSLEQKVAKDVAERYVERRMAQIRL